MKIGQKHVLQWHITGKCNLKCTHCYQDNSYGQEEFNFAQLQTILEQYIQFVNRYNYKGHINITGGEPFMYKELFKFLDLAEDKQITFGILTNGTLLDDKIVKKLSAYKNLSFVQISLDGTQKIHDNIRGTGNFNKAIHSFKLLRRYGIQTMTSFTCHKDNFMCLKKLIKIVRKYKIDRFWCDRLIPMGNNKNQILSTEEYRKVIKILTQESQKRKKWGSNTIIHTNRALQFCESADTVYQCSAGNTLLAIKENGDLLPCRRLPLVLGNVLKDDILSIYENNDTIKELRKKEIPMQCNHCIKAEECRGGAKCLNYAVTGRYDIKDINCYL